LESHYDLAVSPGLKELIAKEVKDGKATEDNLEGWTGLRHVVPGCVSYWRFTNDSDARGDGAACNDSNAKDGRAACLDRQSADAAAWQSWEKQLQV